MHFRFFISLIFLLILTITFSQNQQIIDPNRKELLKKYWLADKLFNDAEKTKNDEEQDELNKQALAGFQNVLARVQALKDDSLTFYCFFKTGVLQHYFGNYDEAKKNYNRAIDLKNKLTGFSDSVFFKPFLYSGIIYYNQSLFDSALFRFQQAEAISDHYSFSLNETERLFNNLGVLYYERGNYQQAKNYFEKAIAVLSRSNIYYEQLLVNYKINLAGVLLKLEEYDSASSIYQALLSYNIDKNEIYHNLGTLNLKLKNEKRALEYFRKINYSDYKLISL